MNLMRNTKRGSYIVEAALSMPVLILCITAIALIINIIAICENIGFSSAEQMHKICSSAYIAETGEFSHGIAVQKAVASDNPKLRSFTVTGFRYRYTKQGVDDLIGLQTKSSFTVANPIGINGNIIFTQRILARAFTGKLENAEYEITEVKKGERIKNAPLPFTTSTLQQEASKALNFPISKTMRIAQQLYEGVDIKGQGTVGIITYLRTDSVRVSDEAEAMAKDFISKSYGDKYLSTGEGTKKSSKNIQDAHEAIRPTDINRVPSEIKESLSRDQFRLYQLIWKRFTASRMAKSEYETTTVKLSVGDYVFSFATSRLLFDGFELADDAKKEKQPVLKNPLTEESLLTVEELLPKQHFTQPPAHYTEASLVKTLEELGIGRPSTYSPTISTILARRYITKESKNLYVTEIGEVVNSIMKESFPTIVDEHFTANMESLLDAVAEGKVNWKTVVENFYPDLKDAIDKAENELEKVTIHDEVTDEICPECGRNLVIKYGPHGKFLACPGFPDCRFTMPYLEKIGVNCPKCGKDVVLKKTRKGRKYYGCIDNPECDFMSWGRPVAEKCPRCGGYMIIKGNKIACADEQCGYVTDKKPEREE